jgi:sterol desaturase/sphingolipid hydroxylase (fatty acid hydroxylase superfamily)
MADLITWAALALIPAFLLLDLLVRARRYNAPRGWRLYALAVSICAIALGYFAGGFFAAAWPFGTLFDLSSLGLWAAPIGILVYEFGHYAWHRSIHTFTPLWRGFHQFHHSAESLDAFGAFFISPQDTLGFTAIGMLVAYPLLNLSPEAGAVLSFFLYFNAMFQHANLRTPRWIGYIIQRPEAHAVHHARGVHRYNYSDLPLVDMIFGTFRNPATFDGEVGFAPGDSRKIPQMLIGLDVAGPKGRGHEPVRRLETPAPKPELAKAA